MSKILRALTSNFMTVTLSGTAVSFRKSYKEGKEVMIEHDGATDESAYSAFRNLIPKSHGASFAALTTDYGAVSRFFRDSTMAAGAQANGKAVKGTRLVASKLVRDGSFLAEFNRLNQILDVSRENFALDLPNVLYAIQASQAIGSSFNPADYKTPDEIRAKFRYTLEGPFPIVDEAALDRMELSREVAEGIEIRMEAAAKRKIAFAQQDIAKEVAGYLGDMAKTMGKLSDFHATPFADRTGRTPAVKEALVLNIQDALKKARLYAVPDTAAGSKLVELIDRIEGTISPNTLTTDLLKSSPYIARTIGKQASQLAEAIDATDWAF